MRTQLRKVGNSIGLIIPAAMARELLLTAGSEVAIELKAGAIVLTPLKRGSKRLPYVEVQLMVGIDELSTRADEISEPLGEMRPVSAMWTK